MLAPLLVAFYETVRQGSVTAAAKRLEVSQPTITARIQQLEKQYGVELFHRRGSRFDLTDAGAALMPLIDRMQQTESDIDFTLRNERELAAGNLRVGATGPYYILPAIAAFHRQYPAVKICVEIGNSQQILDALLDFRVDLAVSSQRVDDPRFARRTIADDPLVVDLGYGASATTTLELRDRLARVRPDVEVVGIEIDPERVRVASAAARDGVSFRLGGFEVPTDRAPAVIRAANVLRQYDEGEVQDAWATLRARLQPGGLLVEGTCN